MCLGPVMEIGIVIPFIEVIAGGIPEILDQTSGTAISRFVPGNSSTGGIGRRSRASIIIILFTGTQPKSGRASAKGNYILFSHYYWFMLFAGNGDSSLLSQQIMS